MKETDVKKLMAAQQHFGASEFGVSDLAKVLGIGYLTALAFARAARKEGVFSLRYDESDTYCKINTNKHILNEYDDQIGNLVDVPINEGDIEHSASIIPAGQTQQSQAHIGTKLDTIRDQIDQFFKQIASTEMPNNDAKLLVFISYTISKLIRLDKKLKNAIFEAGTEDPN